MKLARGPRDRIHQPQLEILDLTRRTAAGAECLSVGMPVISLTFLPGSTFG